MLKRLRWMAMGIGVGAWAQRRFRLWMKSYTPPEVAARAAKRSTEMAERKAGEVRSALSEGRQAMRQREAELRRKVDDQVEDRPVDRPAADRRPDDPGYPPPLHYRPRTGQ